ncbi:hypothetical protein BZA77DRAFT_307768 [Pyronema omphalodes]|nr:hypothetical protein BZA77DRAFT_307768 [Pyronema omphalodes]
MRSTLILITISITFAKAAPVLLPASNNNAPAPFGQPLDVPTPSPLQTNPVPASPAKPEAPAPEKLQARQAAEPCDTMLVPAAEAALQARHTKKKKKAKAAAAANANAANTATTAATAKTAKAAHVHARRATDTAASAEPCDEMMGGATAAEKRQIGGPEALSPALPADVVDIAANGAAAAQPTPHTMPC